MRSAMSAVSLAHQPDNRILLANESVFRSMTNLLFAPQVEPFTVTEFSPPHIARLEMTAPCTPKKQDVVCPVQVAKLKLSTGMIVVPLRPPGPAPVTPHPVV